MPRLNSHINTAIRIIENYKGEIPFAIFIKKFFAAEKKYGSSDRRQISALCYNYFRIGSASKVLSIQEKLSLAYFLCTEAESEIMERLNAEWNKKNNLPLAKKLLLVKNIFLPKNIFPFAKELSDQIDNELFFQSFLIQPNLFLRIRQPGSTSVITKLKKSGLPYQLINESAIQLPAATKLEEILVADKDTVVQDFNSQQVLNYLKKIKPSLQKEKNTVTKLDVWDCCAASGGKSILAYDIFNGKINLTISDIRPSIILNLHQRFKKAGIKEYQYFIADISKDKSVNTAGNYDIIICDAPCSGSGTWGRTPEQLHFFNKDSIETYSNLQKKIAVKAISHLKKDGLFFYITCSVFKRENEEVVDFIQSQCKLNLLEQATLKGYDKKADSMFVAVFQNGI